MYFVHHSERVRNQEEAQYDVTTLSLHDLIQFGLFLANNSIVEQKISDYGTMSNKGILDLQELGL